MAQSNLSIRLDENLKKDFDNVCEDLGLSMTAAFTIFAKTVVRRQGIPFEITRNIPASIADDATSTPEARIAAILASNKIPKVKLEVDENGNAIVDKEKHPAPYEWAVNG